MSDQAILAGEPHLRLHRPVLESAADDVIQFTPVSLSTLGAASLLERIDRKWLAPASALAGLTRRLADDYGMLEIEGRRVFDYSTIYFDTADIALYRAHHAGRRRRHKVRIRRYANASERYLEVKTKTANGRTIKQRALLTDAVGDPLAGLAAIAPDEVLAMRAHLRQALCVEYRRITLVRPDLAERVTIDLMMRFTRAGRVCAFPGAIIIEAKQRGRCRSPFINAMRTMNLREIALSKYCAGIANLEPLAKSNRFRPALRRLATAGQVSR